MQSRMYLWALAFACVVLPQSAVAQDVASGEGIAAASPRFLALADARAKNPARWRDAANEAVFRQRISLDLQDVPLEKALAAIADKAGLRLTYSRAVVRLDAPVSLAASDITVGAALSAVLYNAGVDVLLTSRTHAALIKRPDAVRQPADSVVGGIVVNAATGMPLQGAPHTQSQNSRNYYGQTFGHSRNGDGDG